MSRIHIVIDEDRRSGNPTIEVSTEKPLPRKVKAIWDLILPALEGHFKPAKTYGRAVHGGKEGA